MTAEATEARPIPVADWVTIPDLYRNPYPIYQRLRPEAPIHWVPAVNRYMVLTYEACHIIEQDQERFSANETNSLMKRSQGHSMLRKDDPEHDVERKSFGGVLRPKAIKQHWNAVFEESFATWIQHFKDVGPGADLISEFAGPYAAENLRRIIGFYNATQEDMQRWSQTLIDGTGNYADDPEVWAKAERSYREVDEAIDEMFAYLRQKPDASLLSQLSSLPIPLEAIRANIKVTIGGGINEPRDAVGTTVWALLSNPDQLSQVIEEDRWSDAFEESIRWVAPISMYPREATRDTVVEGVFVPKGARLGVVVAAANRDPAVFENPEIYDINRPKKPHLAFGGGAHFCAGAWVARASSVGVALPRLFRELPGLRLNPEDPAVDGGWVFRGMLRLPVLWD